MNRIFSERAYIKSVLLAMIVSFSLLASLSLFLQLQSEDSSAVAGGRIQSVPISANSSFLTAKMVVEQRVYYFYFYPPSKFLCIPVTKSSREYPKHEVVDHTLYKPTVDDEKP